MSSGNLNPDKSKEQNLADHNEIIPSTRTRYCSTGDFILSKITIPIAKQLSYPIVHDSGITNKIASDIQVSIDFLIILYSFSLETYMLTRKDQFLGVFCKLSFNIRAEERILLL